MVALDKRNYADNVSEEPRVAILERMTDVSTQSSKPGVREVPASAVIGMRERGDDLTFVDVREQHEWNLFRIHGALHIPLGALREEAEARLRPDRTIVLYCARGGRAATGAATLVELGFADVLSVEGGLMGWVNAGGPLDE